MIVSLFAGGVVLLIIFLISQFVQENAMFDVTLFRKPTFDGASVVAFTISSAMFAMFLYLVLYIQTILGLSPLQTGLRFLPFTVVSFFVAVLSGNLSTRVPIRFLLSGGLLLTAIGLLLMRGLTVSSEWTALLAGFIVAGAGSGSSTPRWRRRRSASCRRSEVGWRRASTTPSARLESPPGSPASARSSRAR